MPRVAFQDNDGDPQELRLLGENSPYVLGRAEGCDVVVKGSAVSARHAVLTFRGDHWVLQQHREGLGNIWVNDETVSRSCQLKDGDRIRLGRNTLPDSLHFRDASAWIRHVAPWASHSSPKDGEAVGSPFVAVTRDEAMRRGLPPAAFAIDTYGTGLRATWHGTLLAFVAVRPPGPELMVIEGFATTERLDQFLRRIVSERLGEAVEVAIRPVDPLTRGEHDSFRWLPISGSQCHRLRLGWERGLFTHVVAAPSPRDKRQLGAPTPQVDSLHLHPCSVKDVAR